MEEQIKEEEFLPTKSEGELPVEVEEPFGDIVINEDVVNRVERAVELKKRMMVALLRLTTENDWTNIGGRPYLKSSGCESLADALGISWKFGDVVIRTFNDNGKFVEQYLIKIKLTKPGGRAIETEGIGSTDDDFYSKKGVLIFEEVDRNSVRKKAETNAVERGVSKMLGLRGITWEQLKEAGIKIDRIQKVEYKTTKESTTTNRPQGNPVEAEIDHKIWGMLLDITHGDEDKAREECKKISAFEVNGKRMFFDDPLDPMVSKKWLQSVYGKTKKIWEQKQKEGYRNDDTPRREPGQEG